MSYPSKKNKNSKKNPTVPQVSYGISRGESIEDSGFCWRNVSSIDQGAFEKYYACRMNASALNAHRALSLQKHTSHLNSWVLYPSGAEEPLYWADVFLIRDLFVAGNVFLGSFSEQKFVINQETEKGILLLLSILFISVQMDLLEVFPTRGLHFSNETAFVTIGDTLEGFTFGKESFLRETFGRKINFFKITKSQWQAQPFWNTHLRAFRHLK